MSGSQQFADTPRGAGPGGVTVGGAVRWEQGTCNASFKDEAQKLNQQKLNQKANGKKVGFFSSDFLLHFFALDIKY